MLIRIFYFGFRRDPKEEARVQDAIDMYFQAGNIVPSPWTNNVRKVFFPRTPGMLSIEGAC